MKIYLIDNEIVAKQLSQLLKLNAECARLHWSKTIKELPKNVVSSLEILESFAEEKVYEVCTEESSVGSLNEEEEMAMMSLLRKIPELRATLGTGVVMAGEEAKNVAKILDGKNIANVIVAAINSGKNVIIF